MDEIKIVDYDKSYAKSLAKMWNMSWDNWGGNNAKVTEESVIQENKNVGNINTYLALDGKEVVGYCSFSEYREDEGAMYIPLLNVRPDYHGKKIGKTLVLQAVKRTAELGWPRLDLYTWAGNTKAVPLYKKCGFFWEKRDDATHLMNFIPTVLNTDALSDYFNDLDWYYDSKRTLDIKPDGKEDMNYGNYQYIWQKNHKNLRVEFERRGRGIRVIETDKYKISAFVKEQEIAFGRNYNVFYEIINKGDKPLDIEINGVDDKNIKFSFKKKASVIDNEVIVGKFFLDSIDEEVSHWRTHPCVKANISINGKDALFKIGISPKYPGNLSLEVPWDMKVEGYESKCFLNIENSFSEEGYFNFKLRDNENIKFINNDYSVNLKAKEKKSIPISYVLKSPCIYNENISIDVVLKDDNLRFDKKLSGIFKGLNGKFYGETDGHYIICNGKYTMELSKFNNAINLKNYNQHTFKTTILYPRIGMPYSLEFSKTRPINVEYLTEDEEVILKAKYTSKDFEGIDIISIIRLCHNGILKHNYHIINNSDNDREICLSHDFRHSFHNTVMPYEGEYLSFDISDGTTLDHWNSEKISENWLFANNGRISRGISWPRDERAKFTFSLGYISIDHSLGVLKKNEGITTKPIIMFLDTFKNWMDFRKFTTKGEYQDSLSKTNKFKFLINGGNPFVKGDFDALIKDYKREYFEGSLKLSSLYKGFKSLEKNFKADDSIRESNFRVKTLNKLNLDILNLEVDFENIAFNKGRAVFGIGDTHVTTKVIKEDGLDVYTVNNGNVEFKVSPEFFKGMYSLRYKGNEWIDSAFPKSKAKSWWNPWPGGIITHPEEMSYSSLEEEEGKAEFVKIKDNFDNMWTGIKVSCKISKHKNFKGLDLDQYYLTLPGVPLALTMAKIGNFTGKYINNKDFSTSIFIKGDEKLKDSYFLCKNLKGDIIKYKGGTPYNIIDDNYVIYGGKNRNDKLMVYSSKNNRIHGYSNNELIGGFLDFKTSIEWEKTVVTPPLFMFFNDETLDKKLFNNLENIKF